MSKILVGLKRVVDYNVRVRVKPDGSGVVTDGVKMSINPFDEIALEEALRIKRRAAPPRSIVVSIGPADTQQQLRTGLAMGADRAILVSDRRPRSSRSTAARVFLKLVEKEQPQLVILGKQAHRRRQQPDRPDAGGAVGPPAGDVRLEDRARRRQGASVTREVDAGLETIEVDLPAVITTDLRLNEPRYVKLPDIMKAKKKPLDTLAIADLGVDAGAQFKTLKYEPPAGATERRHGERRRRAGRCAQAEGCAVMAQDSHRRRTCERQTQSRDREVRDLRERAFTAREIDVAGARRGRRRRRRLKRPPIAGRAKRVLKVENAANAEPLAAVLAPQIAAAAANYTHVFGPSTTFGKDLMPRVAALLGVGQLSDVMAVESAYTFRRPIYAGNAIITVEAPAGQEARRDRAHGVVPACCGRRQRERRVGEASSRSCRRTRASVALPRATTDRPDLQTASRVVSGGRALGSADNFKIIYSLADKLGAAVGASRAAVDAGYAPNDLQVGQTGKIIAPELYVAIGISGAIQHLTGIKDARTIVAINKDGEAPIFEVADIGLVGDLFTICRSWRRRCRAEGFLASRHCNEVPTKGAGTSPRLLRMAKRMTPHPALRSAGHPSPTYSRVVGRASARQHQICVSACSALETLNSPFASTLTCLTMPLSTISEKR